MIAICYWSSSLLSQDIVDLIGYFKGVSSLLPVFCLILHYFFTSNLVAYVFLAFCNKESYC